MGRPGDGYADVMERHDHDDTQADAPDLGAAVQLENAETLEGPIGDDPLDAGYVPPDRPFALDDNQVSGAGDTLDERLAREVPDGPVQGDADRSGRLVIDGEGAALETGDAMDATEVGVDGGAASAEEAAMHDVDQDSLVDGEPSVAGDPALVDPEVERELRQEPAEEVAHAREDAERDGALGALGETVGEQRQGIDPLR